LSQRQSRQVAVELTLTGEFDATELTHSRECILVELPALCSRMAYTDALLLDASEQRLRACILSTSKVLTNVPAGAKS
jgi:hypothetical protein